MVVCGFFVGAHPGHIRREDAEQELHLRLQLPPDFQFQLSSRTISVPLAHGNTNRYSFPAVAIVTSARMAKRLQEAMFSLPKPSDAKTVYPYTGIYQFVPVLTSKEWPPSKIFQLVKVQTKICQNLRVIYLENLQDLRNVIGTEGQVLLRGFMAMAMAMAMTRKTDTDEAPLIHSVHNTSRKTIKAVLVPRENYDDALEAFSTLHQQLLSGVHPDFHKKVFVGSLEAGMTSGHRDTIHSCNSSHYANELLQTYNPQDAEEEPTGLSSQKRFLPSVISYAAVVSGTDQPKTLGTNPSQPSQMLGTTSSQPSQVTLVSSLTNDDLDKLYERLKHHLPDTEADGLSSDELEKKLQASNYVIQQVRDVMKTSVTELSNQITTISHQVSKQNTVVLGLQKTLEITASDLKQNVDLKFHDLSQQLQDLHSMVITALPSLALQAAARPGGQAPTRVLLRIHLAHRGVSVGELKSKPPYCNLCLSLQLLCHPM